MTVTIDVNTLTAAEVGVIEDTVDGLFADRLGDEVIGFEDIIGVAQWMEARRRAVAEGGEIPGPPLEVSRKVFNILSKRPLVFQRAIELAVLRRTNPAAKWEDTGKDPMIPAKPEEEAAAEWPSPTPVEPS